jgi:hypothetical protein
VAASSPSPAPAGACSFPANSLVNCTSSGTIYLESNGSLRAFPTVDAYTAFLEAVGAAGYTVGPPETAAVTFPTAVDATDGCTEVAACPVGEPMAEDPTAFLTTFTSSPSPALP